MTEEQEALLQQAAESIAAAKLLSDNGFVDIASSRAYYAMFYSASAMLLNENLRFRKHSGVHALSGTRSPGPVCSRWNYTVGCSMRRRLERQVTIAPT